MEQRWKSFQVKIIKHIAKAECNNLCCATFNNTDHTCTESDVLQYCNFASLKLVNRIYQNAIQEFISNSKNGSTASRKKNLVNGSVSSYIASSSFYLHLNSFFFNIFLLCQEVIILLLENKILVIFSKFSIFLILFEIFLLGLNISRLEFTFGFGKKQCEDTLNFFIIFNL